MVAWQNEAGGAVNEAGRCWRAGAAMLWIRKLELFEPFENSLLLVS